MELQLGAVENDASAIEQFYKPKRKQLLKFKFDCNPSVLFNNAFTSYLYASLMGPMTLDLMTLKSNQFIGSTRYIYMSWVW